MSALGNRLGGPPGGCLDLGRSVEFMGGPARNTPPSNSLKEIFPLCGFMKEGQDPCADFKVIVPQLIDGAQKDVVLYVQRGLLSLASPVFRSMLQHDMLEKNAGQLRVDDCTPRAFSLFLHGIYPTYGRVMGWSGQEPDVIDEVVKLAVKYQVEHLVEVGHFPFEPTFPFNPSLSAEHLLLSLLSHQAIYEEICIDFALNKYGCGIRQVGAFERAVEGSKFEKDWPIEVLHGIVSRSYKQSCYSPNNGGSIMMFDKEALSHLSSRTLADILSRWVGWKLASLLSDCSPITTHRLT
ncbi:unnamed protein product [Chrysoparadoxa australica]